MAILRLPDGYDGRPLPALFHFPGLFETPLESLRQVNEAWLPGFMG